MKRYYQDYDGMTEDDDAGDYVLFEEAQEIIAAKDAKIAELEANERAYAEILGPKSYKELAAEIAELREALKAAGEALAACSFEPLPHELINEAIEKIDELGK